MPYPAWGLGLLKGIGGEVFCQAAEVNRLGVSKGTSERERPQVQGHF